MSDDMNGMASPFHQVTRSGVQWTSIVKSWVNLFEKETLTKISDLKSSKFFTDTIVAIFEFNGMKDVSFKSSNDLAIKFIKEYFPEIIKEKYFSLGNEDDILLLASLLMYTTCIKYKIEDFVSKTSGMKFDDNRHEKALTAFFEMMLIQTDGNFTRRTIMNTIKNIFDPIAVTGARKSSSPSASSSCLKEFLGSPLSQEKFLKNKKETHFKHFNKILQYENSELFSDIETLAKKNEELETLKNKLQTQLHEKSKENNLLKEELSTYESIEVDNIALKCSELKKLTTKNEIMQNNLSASLAENKELEDQLADSLKTVAQLNTAVEDREYQIDQFKTLIQTLSEELKESQLKNAYQSGEIKQLEISKNELKGKLQSKCCELEDLTQALHGFCMQVNDLLAKNLSLDNKLSEALAKTQQLEKEMYESKEQLRHNIAEKESQITELESVINGLKENEKKKETHIEDQVTSLKAKITNVETEIESKEAECLELHKEVARVNCLLLSLQAEYDGLKSENDEMKAQLENARASVRAEYDETLKKMKSHMKLSCIQTVEKTKEKNAKEQKDLQQVVIKNQEHITQLITSLRDTSDQLLITKNQNEELKKEVAELRKALSAYKGAPDSLQRTRSYEHMSLPHQKALRMVREEPVTVSRCQSLRTVPSGIGKVYPSEDEAEEIFNNNNLEDLKAGRCQVPAGYPDRVSTLMYRNSLCLPHLKSSYPGETQFLPIDAPHEDDIKGRTLGDDAKPLPEKRRKYRSQTSYKKPGPLTPSKHGGRTYSQDMELRNVSTSRSALRELPNDENKKPGTPSRLFSHIFSARQRNSVTRNKNVQSTPDRQRLSLFNRHFDKKGPSEYLKYLKILYNVSDDNIV